MTVRLEEKRERERKENKKNIAVQLDRAQPSKNKPKAILIVYTTTVVMIVLTYVR